MDTFSQRLKLRIGRFVVCPESESTFRYFEATRAYIEQHGKSGGFYSDGASAFLLWRG